MSLKNTWRLEDEYVYTAYNYKTLTTRPSNKFGGVNYAALNKENGCRKSFIPRNNRFVEFDIGAYHPTLAAMLVDYEFGDKDIHKSFAEMYKVDYAKAKELTFKQLYGGVFDNYKDLPFFKATSEYIRTTWETFQTEGVITCPISHYEYKNDVLEDMNPQKLFNYILQNMETSLNIEILFRIFTLLKGMNTKLVLYTYDSFLFDLDDSEEEVLEQIKKVFYKLKLQIKEKNGKTIDLHYEYNIYGLDTHSPQNKIDLNNKLFCTFTSLENLDQLVEDLQSQYTIMYNKMFVLHIKSNDEYVVTYNVDQHNVSSIPENTILVHRKKDSNTLYTINALNELIKRLNGGVVDSRFRVDWQHYRNTILLTQQNELKELKTKKVSLIVTSPPPNSFVYLVINKKL